MTGSIDTVGDNLLAILDQATKAIKAHAFPALVVEHATEDGEPVQQLRCPRCGELASEDDLRAVDVSEHWQIGSEVDFAKERVTFLSEDTDLSDTLYYLHDFNHAVSLPEDWDEDWA